MHFVIYMKQWTLILLSCLVMVSKAQNPIFYSPKAERWADSLLAEMPLEDKLGQLFMVAAYSNKGAAHVAEINNLIKEE